MDNTIHKKFKEKYETQKEELLSKIENPSLSSSNLELTIDKALTLFESLEKIWVDGDLKQRQKLQNLVFPSGLGYDKSNDRVRTPKVNAIFGSIPILSKEISNIKKGEPIPVNQFSDCVIAIGFEPMTVCLEGRCSIQLSYATGQNTLANQELTRVLAERLGFEPRQHFRVDRLAICSITTLAPLLSRN